MKHLKYILIVFLFQILPLNAASADGLFVDETSPYYQPIQECIGDKPSQSSNCHYEKFLKKLGEDDLELALEFCESDFNWPTERCWSKVAVLTEDSSYCDNTERKAECLSLYYSAEHRPGFSESDLVNMGKQCKKENILDKCYPLIADTCNKLNLSNCEKVITDNYSADVYQFYVESQNLDIPEGYRHYYLPETFSCKRDVSPPEREDVDQCVFDSVESYLKDKDAKLTEAETETFIFVCRQIHDTYLQDGLWQQCVNLVAQHQEDPEICNRNNMISKTCLTGLLKQQPKTERIKTCDEFEGEDREICLSAAETASFDIVQVSSAEASSLNILFAMIFLLAFIITLFIRIKKDILILEYFAAFFLFIALFHAISMIPDLSMVIFTTYYFMISRYISDYITTPWLYILLSDLAHLVILLPLILALALKSVLNRIIAMIVLTVLIIFGLNFYIAFQIHF